MGTALVSHLWVSKEIGGQAKLCLTLRIRPKIRIHQRPLLMRRPLLAPDQRWLTQILRGTAVFDLSS